MSKNAQRFKKDILFKAIKWGFEQESFTPEQIFNALSLDWEKRSSINNPKEKLIYSNLIRATSQKNLHPDNSPESIFYFLGNQGAHKVDDSRFSLTTEAKFKYIDFLELELARKNSESAQKNALSAQKHARTSIYIAIGALVVSAIGSVAAVITIFIK